MLLTTHYWSLLTFIFGLGLLWLGSDVLVKQVKHLATKMGWSEALLGLTLVAFGINLPELTITVLGALRQMRGVEVTNLVVGNVIGSNMSQLGLVLGLAGLCQTISLKKDEILNHGLALIATTLLLAFFALDGVITSYEGLIFLICYGIYLYITFFLSTQLQSQVNQPVVNHPKFTLKNNLGLIFKIISSLALIIIGSEIVVNHSLVLAESLGMNQLIIGIFVIGIGVSLPEIFVALTALFQDSSQLSIGSMLGGNIVTILLGLGSTALFHNWTITRNVATFELSYLLLTTVVVVLFLLTSRTLKRRESILILLLYVIFSFLKYFGF